MRLLLTFMILLTACPSGDDDDADAGTVADAQVADSGDADAGSADTGEADAGTVGPIEVQILGLNDFHGQLDPPSSGNLGGAEYLGTHLRTLRDGVPHSFTVMAGDAIGGSPLLSGLFHDEPTIEVLDVMDFDVVAVGNHEFDEGPDELLRMQQGGCHPVDGCALPTVFPGAEFSFLAANVFDNLSGETLFPAYAVADVEGVPIAFIGMTLENTPGAVDSSLVTGLSFADEAETVDALVPELQAMGVQSVVLVLHQGGPNSSNANGCVGLGRLEEVVTRLSSVVDLVISGHSHATYVCTMSGVPVTSAGSQGRFVTDIRLTIDRATRDVTAVTAENVEVTQEVTADEDVVAVLAPYRAASDQLANRVVGTITGDLRRQGLFNGESILGRAVADIQLAVTGTTATSTESGAVVAIMHPGGLRADLEYAASGTETENGQVTYAELFAVHPFGNHLITMTLTGQGLHDVLEAQFTPDRTRILQVSHTVSYEWHSNRQDGDRVDPDEVFIDGVPLDLTASYRVTVNSFLAQSAGFPAFEEGADRVGGPLNVDAFATYLSTHSPLAPATEPRITPRQ